MQGLMGHAGGSIAAMRLHLSRLPSRGIGRTDEKLFVYAIDDITVMDRARCGPGTHIEYCSGDADWSRMYTERFY